MNSDISRQIYEDEIRPWLPPRIIDCHAHVTLAHHMGPLSPERIASNWAMEVGLEQSWEQLSDNYRLLFGDLEVRALAFGGVFREVDIERNNSYVLEGLSRPELCAGALCVTRPEWNGGAVRRALERGFVGIKPYPDLAPQCTNEVSIFDFVPRAHLAALDEMGAILMLHLPRKRRLGDPDNIRELLEISDTYPRVKTIVAHIGRSFCLPTARKGLPSLAGRANMWFDTSANLNADVFAYAIETVGPDRILFGSDLPVTLMRGVREHVGEDYINYTDAPYSWNTNRKSPEEEAAYTYFLYEELRALIEAVRRTGGELDIMEMIMYSNAVGVGVGVARTQ